MLGALLQIVKSSSVHALAPWSLQEAKSQRPVIKNTEIVAFLERESPRLGQFTAKGGKGGEEVRAWQGDGCSSVLSPASRACPANQRP